MIHLLTNATAPILAKTCQIISLSHDNHTYVQMATRMSKYGPSSIMTLEYTSQHVGVNRQYSSLQMPRHWNLIFNTHLNPQSPRPFQEENHPLFASSSRTLQSPTQFHPPAIRIPTLSHAFPRFPTYLVRPLTAPTPSLACRKPTAITSPALSQPDHASNTSIASPSIAAPADPSATIPLVLHSRDGVKMCQHTESPKYPLEPKSPRGPLLVWFKVFDSYEPGIASPLHTSTSPKTARTLSTLEGSGSVRLRPRPRILVLRSAPTSAPTSASRLLASHDQRQHQLLPLRSEDFREI